MIKGVAYDLDGTIINTESLHKNGWLHAGKVYGVEITPRMLLEQAGMSDDAATRMMSPTFDEREVVAFVKEKQKYVAMHASEVKLFDGFFEAIDLLEERGIPVWICTSAYKWFVDEVYRGIPGLKRFQIVYREMFVSGKPDPEPLLLTFSKMGISPKDAVYVGDAFNDCQASAAAGCRFVLFGKNDDKRFPDGVLAIRKHVEIVDYLG